jgi:hypothetical protein
MSAPRFTDSTPPRPDPADDRPQPGDAGTPQRPTPRGSARAENEGRESALLADVPPERRHRGDEARIEDEAKQADAARDADEIKHRTSDRGISAAIAGIDITPSEDR